MTVSYQMYKFGAEESPMQTLVILCRGHFTPAVHLCDKISHAKYKIIITAFSLFFIRD